MKRKTTWGRTAAIMAISASALVLPSTANATEGHAGYRVLLSGLAAPTHVSFGRNGSLYVADIGTSSVSRFDLRTGKSHVVASGLGFGPGVDVRRDGTVMITSTLGTPGVGLPPARLLRVGRHGHLSVQADTLAWELAHNPDGQSQAVDAVSNPYSVLALPGRTIVADSGANDLLSVDNDGRIRTLTVFPVIHDGADCAVRPENDPGQTGCDPTPTDVELGPDGFLYVSGLSGEAAGQGRIYKVDSHTGTIVRTWTGLPPLTGIAVAADGTIYAAAPDIGVLDGTDTNGVDDSLVLRIKNGRTTSMSVPAPTDVELGQGLLVAASFAGAVYTIDRDCFH